MAWYNGVMESAEFSGRGSGELKFHELTEEEFGRLKFACGNFLQSVEMYRRYRNLGREAYLVGVFRDVEGETGEGDAKGSSGSRGEIVAAGLVLVRKWRLGKKIMRVPGGWLMDYDGEDYAEILRFLTREMRRFCRAHGGMVVEISPNIVSQPRDNENKVVEGMDHLGVRQELVGMGYKYLGEYEQAKWVYALELPGKTPEGMLMEFRTTHRQLIKKAEREGVRVRELKKGELGILKRITAESGERHGFQEPEIEYYKSMKEAFGEKVKFVVAEIPALKLREEDLAEARKRLEGVSGVAEGYVPLAASMFIDDGREMVYLYSGTIRRLQRYNGAYAIQWWAIQRALQEERERYNMYGVRPVAGNGVYAFKQGFRGHVEELLGTFALPVGLVGRLYLLRLKAREYGEIR